MQETAEEPSSPPNALPRGSKWVVYGTGEVAIQTLEAARDAGLSLVIAGRNAERLSVLADEFEVHSFVATPDAISDGFAGNVSGVLNLSGPSAATAPQIIESCLTADVHYVDVAGEASVHRATHALDDSAREKGVALVAGAGMGSYLTERLVHALVAELAEEVDSATVISLPSSRTGGRSHRSPGVTASHGVVMSESPRIIVDDVEHQLAETERVVALEPWVGVESGVIVASGDLIALTRSSGIANLRMLAGIPQTSEKVRAALSELAAAAKQAAVYQPTQKSTHRAVQQVHDDPRPRLMAEVIGSRGAVRRGRVIAGSGTGVAARIAVEVALRLTDGGLTGSHTAYQVLGRSVELSNLGVKIEIDAISNPPAG